MFNAFAKVTAGKDLTPEVKKLLDELAHTQVLVGVPEGSDNNRSEGITNAQLLYVHTHGVRQKEMRDEMNPKVKSGEMYSKAFQMFLMTHGSPLWRSPPRPVIEPAIESRKEYIAKRLKLATEQALNGEDPTPELEKAGFLGMSAAQDWFNNPANGWAPNSPRTIAEKGSDIPLIDTSGLRKSITYVVTKDDGS